ncbi:unnamed protein product [Lampetra fluviatilis]
MGLGTGLGHSAQRQAPRRLHHSRGSVRARLRASLPRTQQRPPRDRGTRLWLAAIAAAAAAGGQQQAGSSILRLRGWGMEWWWWWRCVVAGAWGESEASPARGGVMTAGEG